MQKNLPLADLAITTARFIKWAEECVKETPTYEVYDHYDEKKRKCVYINKPNTVELVLANFLAQEAANAYDGEKASTLVEEIKTLCFTGTKGYAKMKRPELLRHIQEWINDLEAGTTWDDLQLDVDEEDNEDET